MIGIIWNGKLNEIPVHKGLLSNDIVKEASKISGIPLERVRLTYNANGKEISLQLQVNMEEIPVKTFYVFDSGFQIDRRVDLLLEYVTPIPIWFLMLKIINHSESFTLKVATIMWVAHYTKRSIESVFVHTFSNKYISLPEVAKNCSYYWIFSLLISFFIIKSASAPKNRLYQLIGVIMQITGELLNGYSHLKLRSFRKPGSKDHVYPTGFLFDHIVCPHYTFEILSWIGFALFTQHFIALLFPVCGGGQMFIWADDRRRRYALTNPSAMNRGRLLPHRYL